MIAAEDGTEPSLLVIIRMANKLPYVLAACICENILQQAGYITSLIRIVDTFGVQKPAGLPPGVVGAVALKAFVSVKSGDITGKHVLGLVFNYPSGKKVEIPSADVELKGGVHGHQQTYNLSFEVGEYGLHWFDVLWDGEMLTRIPLMLQQAESGQTAPAQR